MTVKASAKKKADSWANDKSASTTFEGSTHYDTGVVASLTLIPVCDTGLSDELVDKRIDDHTRNRFSKLY